MHLDPLLPPGDPVDPTDLLAADRPGDHAGPDRPYVVANMIATLDGVAAIDGGSSALGGAGDKAMFGALRTTVDAVLAGTATVAAERYGRMAPSEERRERRAALGLAPDPPLVLITRSGDVPFDAPVFAVAGQPVIVVCEPGAVRVPDVAAHVTVTELEELTNAAALRALRTAHGVRGLLCEGGPRLLRALLADGLLDELFLTLDPQLAAGDDAARILAGPGLDGPPRGRLVGVLRAGDELLLRYALHAAA